MKIVHEMNRLIEIEGNKRNPNGSVKSFMKKERKT